MMEDNRIRELLDRYLDGTATRAERQLVESHYNHLLAQDGGQADRRQLERATQHMRTTIQKQTGFQLTEATPQRRRKLVKWLPYAAAVAVVALAIGTWFISFQQSAVSPGVAEILPGGNRATLTLADGRTIDLSEEQDGIVVSDGITYLDGSAVLSPEVGKSESPEERTPGTENSSLTTNYYVLSTPKGGTYQVTLPDGSKVWLNSASTLKYPSRFSTSERTVQLQGEAFFSVTEIISDLEGDKRVKQPFKVQTAGQVVEVLGTEFNVSAYEDDPETRTTLVEGKVKVAVAGDRQVNTQKGLSDLRSSGLSDYLLQPGEQSVNRGAAIEITKVNTDQFTAWKSGLFAFHAAPIGEVMKQLERWYDIEVVYQGTIPTGTFDGKISRDLTLQQLLRGLAQTRIDYTIEGRTLTIIGEK